MSKDLYETLGALCGALPAHMQEEFRFLMIQLTGGHPTDRETVFRWLRDVEGFPSVQDWYKLVKERNRTKETR